MEQQSGDAAKDEIAINSDRRTTLVMAVLLILSVLLVIADIRRIAIGRVAQHVSIYTVIFAALCFFYACGKFSRIAKGGFVLLGIGTSLRAATFYLHASDSVQYIAAFGALVLGIFAGAMIFISAVQWFQRVAQLRGKPVR
jgi:uncharacterized membrane protein